MINNNQLSRLFISELYPVYLVKSRWMRCRYITECLIVVVLFYDWQTFISRQ